MLNETLQGSLNQIVNEYESLLVQEAVTAETPERMKTQCLSAIREVFGAEVYDEISAVQRGSSAWSRTPSI